MLTERGLEAALDALLQRAPLSVNLHVDLQERVAAAIEAAAYFVVSEALTNIAKYASAETVTVDVVASEDSLVVTIADDGAGGADPAHGSGLRGVLDRVNAVGGALEVHSPAGRGTRLCARLPTRVLGSQNCA